MLPHAYAGIQSHIRQGQLIGPVWTPTCAGERSELRARDPHTKQSLRNLASFRQMGLSERYLGPFPFAVFFERTPGPPSFSSMNSDRPNRLSKSNSKKLDSFRQLGVRAAQSICGLFPLAVLRNRTPGPPPFSSMNSTPANSMPRRTARSLAAVIDVSRSVSSARRMVATLVAQIR